MIKSFFSALLAFIVSVSQLVFTPNVIRIDFDNVVDEIRPVHNIGRMPEYELNSEVNKYFTDANMTSCRTHDINCTDIYRIFPDFSADVNDESSYRFADSDKVLAAIVDAGMEPFFRFGISYSDPVLHHDYLVPPTDYTKWAQICEHIILHYNEGWANGFEYDIEYWEIWNEPENSDDINDNHFWIGSDEDFFRLYDVSAKYLKEKFPALKIGGYGSCGFYALTKTNAVNTGSTPRNQYFVTYFENFLEYVQEHNSPMDFFSWHSYTVTKKNKQYISYVREMLANAGYGECEIICDEWNYNPTENVKIDRRYGANQTSMLIMFQNEGLDLAHYYCAIADGGLHSGMFYKGGKPTSAYYGFRAFGQLYKLGYQAEIKNRKLREDLYAVAATGKDGQALLISNVSDKKDRKLRIDAGDYTVDKCWTVNENCEWVEIPIPDKIEAGTMLYITFKNVPDTIKAPDNSGEMHLVWHDEFNTDTLDSTKWTLRAKMRQSDIINGNDEHNVKVENGELVMRTWKEDDGTYSTNTSVTTDGTMSFKYGYLEMYANVPFVDGCWPSFWMQSKDIHRTSQYMTEIDMFEIYNTKNTVRTDIHKWYLDTGEHYNIGGTEIFYKFRKSSNLNNEYHRYGFGWTPEKMYFTVDGKIYGSYDLSKDFGDRNDGMQGFHDPVYIIFNNFIFTDNSSWKNPAVNENTEWPITYKIDWIRLYQKDGEGEIFDDTGC